MAATDKSSDMVTDLVTNKRTPKCPGCKLTHNVHSFRDPGPHCTGPTGLPDLEHSTGEVLHGSTPPTDSGPSTATEGLHVEQSIGALLHRSMPPTDSGATKDIESWHDSTPPPEDEEAMLSAKLQNLKLAEVALAKKKHVEQLKTTAIA